VHVCLYCVCAFFLLVYLHECERVCVCVRMRVCMRVSMYVRVCMFCLRYYLRKISK